LVAAQTYNFWNCFCKPRHLTPKACDLKSFIGLPLNCEIRENLSLISQFKYCFDVLIVKIGDCDIANESLWHNDCPEVCENLIVIQHYSFLLAMQLWVDKKLSQRFKISPLNSHFLLKLNRFLIFETHYFTIYIECCLWWYFLLVLQYRSLYIKLETMPGSSMWTNFDRIEPSFIRMSPPTQYPNSIFLYLLISSTPLCIFPDSFNSCFQGFYF
jgi:hypothetical protein